MNIVDIDPCVMQSEELENIINRKLLEKGINVNDGKREWGDATCELNSRQIRTRLNSLRNNYQKMCVTWEIYDQPIVSHRRVFGKIIVSCKRAVRKLTRWLILPYFAQIMTFHSATLKVVEEMIELQEQLVMMEEAKDNEQIDN